MASNVYEQFLSSSESNQLPSVASDQDQAIGPNGEVLDLKTTGAANALAPAQNYVTKTTNQDNPYAQFLEENQTQSTPQATPQPAQQVAQQSANPYAQFSQPTAIAIPEQTGKTITLPADHPWYSTFGREAAAQTASSIIRQAEGLERAGAQPITSEAQINAPFQRQGTPEEVSSTLDKSISDQQAVLDKLNALAQKKGFTTADLQNQINTAKQNIEKLQTEKQQTLQRPEYSPEAQQQLLQQREQMSQEATQLEQQAQSMFPYFDVSPTDTSLSAQLGRGTGSVLGLAPAMLTGPMALPVMAIQGASEAYAVGYNNRVQELKQQGVTDPKTLDLEGHKAGSQEAVATIPSLAAYTVGGELTAGATSALMKGASPLVRGLVGGTAAAGVNLATSGTLRAMQGQNFMPNVEQAVPDLVFGGLAGIHSGLAPSGNPVVNEREAKINAAADAQANVPLTPEQQKFRDDLEKRGNQYEELRKRLIKIVNQLQELPEDHPDRPKLREDARKISDQLKDLREGKSVDIEPEQPQGDERFKPKPSEEETTTEGEKPETGGVSPEQGISPEVKPEGEAEAGTPQPQGEGEKVGGESETTQTTEAELRSAMPNTAFFDEANEALQRLNQEDARGNKRQRFHLPTLQDLRQLINNPAYKLADKLAGIFGKKIVLYKGEEGTYINGATSNDPALKNYIFLKIDGQRPHLFTAGHELWHHIELYSPVLANSLRMQMTPLIRDWAGLRGKYKEAGYSESRFFDEHIADFLGDAMQDPKFWNTLAKKNPKSFKELATKTIDWLNKLLYQLKDWRMGGDYTRDIEKARDMLADGLNNFAQGKDEPVGPLPEKTYSQTQEGPMFQQDREEKRNRDFYSQLQRTITDKMPNKASVEQIKAIIDPAKGSGVKPDELKWSNLDGFLEGKKSVTKEEVLDYLKNEGAVKFEEVRLGARPDEVLSDADKERLAYLEKENAKTPLGAIDDRLGSGTFQELMRLQNIRDKSTADTLYAKQEEFERQARQAQRVGNQTRANALWKEANHMTARAEALEINNAGIENRPIYGQYTLPNSENYREVVLTMPPKNPIGLAELSHSMFGKDYADLTNEQAESVMRQREKNQVSNPATYTSSHFREIPNYVAHMRLDERPDSEGRNGLFIEEIQSDRHQAGREQGYGQGDPLLEKYVNTGGRITQEERNAINAKYPNIPKEGEIIDQVAQELEKQNGGGIPDAPFRKDWPIQMFKRALRDAIASGKEWVGWTKGDTQAERYDLSKQVDKIYYEKRPNRDSVLIIASKGGNEVTRSEVKNDKLSDTIGKELAQRVINDTNLEGELKGNDLKVGGQGMKGFYDQILPKEIAKYVKKWGAKVEEGKVGSEYYKIYDPTGKLIETHDTKAQAMKALRGYDEGYTASVSGEPTTPIWKVEITPEMRESVTKEGQPMFQQDRPTEEDASRKREKIETKFQSAPIRKTKNTIVNIFKRKPAKEAISYMRDAGDNAANIYAKQNSNEIANDLKREFKGQKDKAAEALSFVIEAKGDQAELANMRQKIANSPDASEKWKKKAIAAIDFADNNFSRFDPIVQKYEQIGLHQVAQENANGIDTPVREGYVPHYQDLEEQELFGGAGTGSATGFRKMRTFDTFADSIAGGIDPKSINAVDLLQKRLASGQKSINYRSWIDSLKQTIDPASGDPIATKVSIVKRADGSSYIQVPRGYKQETLAGQRVAIKDGYEGIISALNDPSAWSKNMAGQMIQKGAGLGKSLTLGLDTYHLGRIAIWESLIKALGIKTFKLPLPSYRKGATLLDQSIPELQKMIANGEIPRSYAKGLLENKRLLNLAVKTGYNIGGISDSLHQDWVHSIPVLGDFNSWLFNQFQRGAMAETWLLEFQRYRNAYPEKSEADVARMVSKDLNTRFGNLGRQGLLKSKTMQDTARFLFLAPQWNEGLIRTELGAMGQTGRALLDAATGKRLFAGVLARSVGGMIAAQFVANQLINYATRGTPTWENPEEGIGAKISAWIPDAWGGPGFFLNPMSLATETTHLLLKGYERTGDALETAMNYFRSRSSVPMRPVWDAVTNKNVLGTYYAPGQKWKGMLEDAIPYPIAGGTIYAAAREASTGEPNQQFQGQYQKQLFQTFGVKLEGAPSDESRIYTLANHFKLDNNIQDRMAGYSSPYSELNHSLMIGNMTNAKNALTKLLETRTPAQIQKYYKDTYPNMRLMESKNQQKEFLDSLNDEQRDVYDRAKEHRKDTSQKALDLLREIQ
jgi:hypothetical protein